MRKTKIICTLGPSSGSEEVIKELFKAGMNVGRMNMSHGSHADHRKNITTFRKVRDELFPLLIKIFPRNLKKAAEY